MRAILPAVILFTLRFTCACEHMCAQPENTFAAGRSELGVWLSASLTSATVPYRDGEVSFGKSYVVGVRYGRVLATAGGAALMYLADLVPLAVVTEIPHGADYTVDGAPAYGFGLSPLGLSAAVAPSSRLALYVGATGGLVLFNRGVPVTESHKLNFRLEADVGIRLTVASSWGATLGIGLQHLSNGTRRVPNPGLDYRVLSFGVAWAWGP
jgi:hypothetical protein